VIQVSPGIGGAAVCRLDRSREMKPNAHTLRDSPELAAFSKLAAYSWAVYHFYSAVSFIIGKQYCAHRDTGSCALSQYLREIWQAWQIPGIRMPENRPGRWGDIHCVLWHPRLMFSCPLRDMYISDQCLTDQVL
jgi:hypothetical protein